MIRHNQKRYDPDHPDFIIPFLINHSTEGLAKIPSATKRKRYSVSSKAKDINFNSSTELVKAYKTNTKKSPEKQEKGKSFNQQQNKTRIQKSEPIRQQLRDKGHSQLQLCLHKSPYVAKNRFYKAQSLINHTPIHNFSEEVAELKPSPQKIDKDSPIPGIRFKKKLMFNQSANLIVSSTPATPDEDFPTQFKGKIKNWREKKQWNRKRSANVDFIINRKCKNFNDLIGEYKKRLGLSEAAKIFIFNSKDSWLRRVLGERGWIQNMNKESRAFHLYWSNKIYKEIVFPEQLINHYRSSDLLTSKAGLHKMLLKYGLTHFQPVTFDLTLQRDEFMAYFTKLAFISRLGKLIKKFQFEEQPDCISFQELKAQLSVLQNNSSRERLIECDLMGVAESCFILLEGKQNELTTYYLDRVMLEIHSMLKLTFIEEQLVRIIRDFQFLIKKNKIFSRETASSSENIWLTKSKNSSKGVGISLHKDLDSILKHQNRLAQKYIENPLIFSDSSIKGRKFDVRVWVLLVGNLKSRVYYHQKFYGRLCFEPYSLDTINLDNQKKHLTNYSQNKLSFREETLEESILLPDAIFHLINQEKGFDFKSKFFNTLETMLFKMMKIFQNELAVGNPNSFQLFGFDLLIDNELNMHLLEINLSAACQERHEALVHMMEDVAHGMLNILDGFTSPQHLRGWKLVK